MTGEKISFKASFECFKGWRLPDMKGQRIPDRRSSNPQCPRSNGSFYMRFSKELLSLRAQRT